MTGASTDGRQAIRAFAEHEHEELAAGIGRIHELGEELATMPVDQRAAGIRKVLHWVDADLKPHMAWEESWLFPLIDDRTRTSWATRYARFDHQQIAAQAERLHAHSACREPLPRARRGDADRGPVRPRDALARHRRARGTLPASVAGIRGRTMGTGVAGLTPGPEDTCGSAARASDSGRPRSPASVDHWGFLAHPDLPDGPGPAFLLVALRPAPTLQHYDPEAIDYWVTERWARLAADAHPRHRDAAVGGLLVGPDPTRRPTRRLERVPHLRRTSGCGPDRRRRRGRVRITSAVATTWRPLPGLGRGADAIGGFFARMMVAVDFKPALRGGPSPQPSH